MDYLAHFIHHLEKLRPPHVSTTPELHTNASEAGYCDRKLFYRLQRTQATGDSRELPEYTNSIIFHLGNNLHDNFQDMMKVFYPDFSHEVKWQYPATGVPIVTGRCDGTYTTKDGKTAALEIKSCSKWVYAAAMKRGVPRDDHALQAALSSAVLHTDLVHIVYICREYMDEYPPLTSWLYPVSPAVAVAEIKRHQHLRSLVQTSGPIPDRTARGEDINDPETDPECRYCPFVDQCLIDGPIPVRRMAPRKKKGAA